MLVRFDVTNIKKRVKTKYLTIVVQIETIVEIRFSLPEVILLAYNRSFFLLVSQFVIFLSLNVISEKIEKWYANIRYICE